MPSTTASKWWRTGLACLLGAWGLLPTAAQAQASTPAHVRADSLRIIREGRLLYLPAQLTLTNGKQVRAYVEAYTPCLLDQVSCYEVPPTQLPLPPLKAISIERLKSMTVDGHFLEALYMRGKPLKVLAENLAAPGPMQIFGYAKTKNDMLIPIPLPVGAYVVSTGTHDKYYWYVRLAEGELQELPRGQKAFVEVMSNLCRKAPELVAELQSSAGDAARKPRYRIDNAPELVRQYNAAVAAK